MRLQLATDSDDQPDFLDLPWEIPLTDWPDDVVVNVPAGLHRNVVKFVASGNHVYALKELPGRLAHHEWQMLRQLRSLQAPVVVAQGVAADRGDGLNDVIITRHLEFSIPYRLLFRHATVAHFTDKLIDALAWLLVRLHLDGFYWGDCSLSNALFRRDAGVLTAYLVDAETGELHGKLPDVQRDHDLELAKVNVLGGLLDLEAAGELPTHVDPVATVESLVAKYCRLWDEITGWQEIPLGERHRIDERLARLTDLGFETAEIEMSSTKPGRLRFRPMVVEDGYSRRRLVSLTGLHAQENQARRLLNDISSYGAFQARAEGRTQPEALQAYRWLTEVFEPAMAEVPEELRDRRDSAELFHEVLLHRERLAADGTMWRVPAAAADYAASVLPELATERTLVGDGNT